MAVFANPSPFPYTAQPQVAPEGPPLSQSRVWGWWAVIRPKPTTHNQGLRASVPRLLSGEAARGRRAWLRRSSGRGKPTSAQQVSLPRANSRPEARALEIRPAWNISRTRLREQSCAEFRGRWHWTCPRAARDQPGPCRVAMDPMGAAGEPSPSSGPRRHPLRITEGPPTPLNPWKN